MNEKDSQNGENFDWVVARANYSLGKVFKQLRDEAEIDVQKRNDQRPPANRFYQFSVVDSDQNSFIVLLNGNNVTQRSVRFNRTPTCIAVYDDKKVDPVMTAQITLGNDGQCRLRISEKEYEFWQVRRKALESLFFEFVTD